MKFLRSLPFVTILATLPACGETCVTQSQMTAAVRDGIAAAARTVAGHIQANDAAALKPQSITQLSDNFAGVASVVGDTAPRLKGASLVVDSVWLLDASSLKPNADGTPASGQFFCSLNNSSASTDFVIDGLPTGKYAFSVMSTSGVPAAWQISMLLKEEDGAWKLAGLYPKPSTAAGHDGLWYWTTARGMAKQNQHWNAYFYYQQAVSLLRPVSFMNSTHLEKLLNEMTEAAPPAISKGVSKDAPYVLRTTDGTEYRFTSFGQDDSLGKDKVDLVMHLKVETLGDAAVARKRNTDAAKAMVTAYPELRSAFHGIWVSSEAEGAAPFATEDPMDGLR